MLMDLTTLERANALNKKLKELQQALNCFQWRKDYGDGTTNPRLIIEFDSFDAREEQLIPMDLSDALLALLKQEIINGLGAAIAEFNAL